MTPTPDWASLFAQAEADFVGRMGEISEHIGELNQQIEVLMQDSQEDQTRGADFAESARRGDLGRDWQILQRRIDSGQTTLEDIFSGADNSPEAKAIVEASQQGLAKLHQAWTDQADQDSTAQTPLSELASLESGLAENLRALNDRLRGLEEMGYRR